MARTLAEGLQSSAIDWNTLHSKYNPLLKLVQELLGIIPNCDPTLEIWPPGFRTYNLLVPNLFNLPATLFGSKSFKAAMGLAMYASSKAACAYCTAHACSFALRRGARAEAINGVRTEKEQAVVTLAEALAQVPTALTLADVGAVRRHFSPSQTEWLVNSISMMGFLNKFMNAMGVQLEQEAINDTAPLLLKTGWEPGIHSRNGFQVTKAGVPQQDNLGTYLRVIRQAPGAFLWENKWTRRVPAGYAKAADYLQQYTGSAFPVLAPVKEARVVRTITAVLRDSLDAAVSVTGLKMKMYAGYFFSKVVLNDRLSAEIKSLSLRWAPELNNETYKLLEDFSGMEIPTNSAACNSVIISLEQQLSLSEKEAAVVLLAVVSSHSPAQTNDAVIEAVLKHMEPAGVVEIVVWLSVLQLLHRLSSYYMVTDAYSK